MSENQDRVARILAWASEMPDRLTPLVEDSIRASEPELKAGDLVGAQRKARVVVTVGAATKTVVSLMSVEATARAKSERRKVATPQEEDEMDYRDDDSPETLERLRDELERRLTRLQSAMEARGMAATSAAWAAAGAPCEPVRPS